MQQRAVAGNKEPGFEAEAVVHRADAGDRGLTGGVEARLQDDVPRLQLHRLGMGNVRLVPEQARGFGKAARHGVEAVEDAGQMGLNLHPAGAQRLHSGGVDAVPGQRRPMLDSSMASSPGGLRLHRPGGIAMNAIVHQYG